MNRKHYPVTLQQASRESPTLARLAAMAEESGRRLQAVLPLLPAGMRGAVQAGPVDGEEWCLLVSNTAAAAKLRQLLPALMAHLRSHGWPTRAIRLKVRPGRGAW
ncbi:MAG: hypothetical protein PGN26_12390 [Xylophilus ampelinus]